jgi:hypothetical protein
MVPWYVHTCTNNIISKPTRIQALRCNEETHGRTYVRTYVPVCTSMPYNTTVHVYVPWYVHVYVRTHVQYEHVYKYNITIIGMALKRLDIQAHRCHGETRWYTCAYHGTCHLVRTMVPFGTLMLRHNCLIGKGHTCACTLPWYHWYSSMATIPFGTRVRTRVPWYVHVYVRTYVRTYTCTLRQKRTAPNGSTCVQPTCSQTL